VRPPRVRESPDLARVSCLDASISFPAIFAPEQFPRGPNDDHPVPVPEYRPVETRWTVWVFVSWAGGIQSAPGVRQRWFRRPRVTARASRDGVSVPPFHADTEGPRTGSRSCGRGRRSLGPQRAGASKARAAPHPRGKKRTRHGVPTTAKTAQRGGLRCRLSAWVRGSE
jgi:hypothetical protein